jgi:SAM-dependent methyltransferase
MPARYDGHAAWYDEAFAAFARDASWTTLVERMLGAPDAPRDICLDVGCGTGLHASSLSAAGYRAVGVDISHDQLLLARERLHGAALGDAARLPVASGSVSRVMSAFTHTDMDDFDALVREAARVLRPGGRFAYIGLHPCFVGTFADRRDEPADARVEIRSGYGQPEVALDTTGRFTLRSRVGGSNLSLGDLLTAFLNAPGLVLRTFAELDNDGQQWQQHTGERVVPWNVAVSAEKLA